MTTKIQQQNIFTLKGVIKHFERELRKPGCHPCDHLYYVNEVAEHIETGEMLVIFQEMWDKHRILAMPIDKFLAKVDKEKYPGIRQEYVFEKHFCYGEQYPRVE